MTLAEVRLWGTRIGAVASTPESPTAAFQYDTAFLRSGIEVAPLTMPLRAEPYTFPALAPATFHSLPGLLADSLPDRFGTALIDSWLARQGRAPESFTAVMRLCYIGTRGLGALEYAPATGPRPRKSERIHVDELVALASEILTQRHGLATSLSEPARERALREILVVGTSAGGARAKAVIAWNPATNEVRSGQVAADPGFEHWLLKFDGVRGNKDKELDDPQGYGSIEYAYSLMARQAGITMAPCRILEEGDRRHFMTRRFDRLPNGEKLHMQTLGALAHFDYNQAGAHSYEQALIVIRRLGLDMATVEEQFRRMVFNVVARNQDDHVKNIAFLMDRLGRWTLSPAFDVIYSYAPAGSWTSSHQLSVNGKRDGFRRDDLRAVAAVGSMSRTRTESVIDDVLAAVRDWPRHAAAGGVTEDQAARIAATHRLDLR